jgi:predicted nucleic acid-binding protein
MMNDILPNEKVFLDTTFLVSFSVADNDDLARAQKMLATLMINNCTMYTSMLCVHELLAKIKYIHNAKYGNYPKVRKINEFLRKICLKIMFQEMNYSYSKIHDKLENSITALQQGGFIQFAGLESKHLNNTLDSIKKYDSQPGDSFHYSVMLDLGISTIVTRNKKDFQKMGLKPVWLE